LTDAEWKDFRDSKSLPLSYYDYLLWSFFVYKIKYI